MPQNHNKKTPKYPCGTCGIGIRYSAIHCTGICRMWFHATCLNMTEKSMKKMTKAEINNWICNNCKVHFTKVKGNALNQINLLTTGQNELEPDKVAQNTTAESIAEQLNFSSLKINHETINSPLKALEHSLIENDCTSDTEEKLTMAAKIGAALLEENSQLKRENSILESKLASTEAKMEEIEKESERLLRSLEISTQKSIDTEVQLTKEKLNNCEIQNIFEDHDKKQEQLINNYEHTIASLKKTIQHLKRETKQSHTQTTISTGTQTSPSNDLPLLRSSTFLMELAQLKSQQNILSSTVNDLGERNQCHCTYDQNPAQMENKIIPRKNETPNTPSMWSPKLTQRQGLQTKTKQIFPERRTKTKNNFSISLQVSKARKTDLTVAEPPAAKINLPQTALTQQNTMEKAGYGPNLQYTNNISSDNEELIVSAVVHSPMHPLKKTLHQQNYEDYMKLSKNSSPILQKTVKRQE